MRKFLPAIILSFFLFIQHSFGQAPTEVTFNGIPNLANGDLDWGDYDGDGDMDLLISGWDGLRPSTRLLKRSASGFDVVIFPFPDVYQGDVGFIDVDADGVLDVFISGKDENEVPRFQVFRNVGDDQFELMPFSVAGVYNSQIVWKDFTNDGKIDLIYTGTGQQGEAITDFLIWIEGSFINRGEEILDVRDASIMVNSEDTFWEVMISGRDNSNSQRTIFYEYLNETMVPVNKSIGNYEFDFGNIVYEDFDEDGDPDYALYTEFGETLVLGKNNGSDFFETQEIDLRVYFPVIDTTEIQDLVTFRARPFYAQTGSTLWPNIEVRFGQGTQLAHRFTVDGRGSGVSFDEYIYQDYVEVPFQVWDVDNNIQLMASFRDQQEDGQWNLLPWSTSDPATDSREYLIIHDIPYDESAPNEDVQQDLSDSDMDLFFWMAAKDEPTDLSDVDVRNLRINKSIEPSKTNDFDEGITILRKSDFNKDGSVDLLVGTLSFNPDEDGLDEYSLRYFENKGDFVFEESQNIAIFWDGSLVSDAGFADFNGDGFDDTYIFELGAITIYLNDGTGKYGDFFNSYFLPNSFANLINDVNGDGTDDIISISGYVLVFEENFEGILTLQNLDENNGKLVDFFGDSYASVGDFNNDGFPDVFGTLDGKINYLHLNQAGSAFLTEEPIWMDQYDHLRITNLESFDLNQDSYADLIIIGVDGNNNVDIEILYNDQNGSMNAVPFIDIDKTGILNGATDTEIFTIDLNGDDLLDINIVFRENGILGSVNLLNNDEGFSVLSSTQDAINSGETVRLRDATQASILSLGESKDYIGIFELNTDQSLNFDTISYVTDSLDYADILTYDVDADNYLDLIATVSKEGNWDYLLYQKDGSDLWSSSEFIDINTEGALYLDDFNGDDVPDFTWMSRSIDQRKLRFFSNTTVYNNPERPAVDTVIVQGNNVNISWSVDAEDSAQLRFNYSLRDQSNTLYSGDILNSGTLNTNESLYQYDHNLEFQVEQGVYQMVVQSVNHGLAFSDFSDTIQFEVTEELESPRFVNQLLLSGPEVVYFSDGGDIDGDGDLDFIVFDGALKMLVNLNGQLTAELLEIDLPYELVKPYFAWGDIDNDNDLDVLVADQRQSFVLENLGGINFGALPYSAINPFEGYQEFRSPVALDLVDIDRNGFLDVFIVSSFLDRSVTYAYLNMDGNNFEILNLPQLERPIFNADFKDFDNDGFVDLLINPQINVSTADNSTSTPYMYLGSPDLKFENLLRLPDNVLDPNAVLKVVDQDQDGDWDILFSDGHIAINTYGEFHYEKIADVVGNSGDAITGGNTLHSIDYDQDGDFDLIVQFGDDTYWYNYQLEMGIFHPVDEDLPGFKRLAIVQFTDIDGDGTTDILTNKTSRGSSTLDGLEKWNNTTNPGNSSITTPTNLSYSFDEVGDLIVSWIEENPGLTHNVLLYNEEGYLHSFSSDTSTGYNFIKKPGNAGFQNQMNVGRLEEGKYQFKVQNVSATGYNAGQYSDAMEINISVFNTVAELQTESNVLDLKIIDVDNDGDYDIYYSIVLPDFFVGLKGYHYIFENIGDFNFVSHELNLEMTYSFSDWGDFNNDGLLDLALNGVAELTPDTILVNTKIFKNKGNFVFEDILIALPGTNGYPEFAVIPEQTVLMRDIDNDGKEDLFVNGSNSTNFGGILSSTEENLFGGSLQIYKQDLSQRLRPYFNLPVETRSQLTAGDYDMDGYLDIAMNEFAFGAEKEGLLYNAIGFDTIPDQIFGTSLNNEESILWIDTDQDGDLDLIANGLINQNTLNIQLLTSSVTIEMDKVIDLNNDGFMDGYNHEQRPEGGFGTKFYFGDASGRFSEYSLGGDAYNFRVYGVADFNNDGNLEIVVKELGNIKILGQDFNSPNKSIGVPQLLEPENSDSEVILKWDKVSDENNSYNVSIQDDSDRNSWVVSPLSTENGFRQVLRYGNAYLSDQFVLDITDLNDGLYNWSVQAVNASYKGGEFAPTSTFKVCTEFDKIDFSVPENVGVNSYVTFQLENIPENQVITYDWSYGDGESGSDSTHYYSSTGIQNVVLGIENQFGCTNTISKSFDIEDIIPVRVSNVITPNNDGKNDVLFIENIERYPDNKVRFLTLDGQQLFEASGYQNDWSPASTGFELASGTYICLLKLTENDFERKVLVRVIR